MPKKKIPVTFDEHLGKVIDDETAGHGGRPQIAAWTGQSEQSINRRARGEVGYLVREVEVIAGHLPDVTAGEMVALALRRFGGIEKLLEQSVSELARTVTEEDELPYIGRVERPVKAAADEKPRTPGKD